MIDIKFKDGKFLAKGTFELGMLGKFENKTYDDTMIKIAATMLEMEEVYEDNEGEERDEYTWGKATEAFLKVPCNGDAIAKFMTDYYNKREKQLCSKQFNDMIWYKLFQNLIDTEYPIYEIEQAITRQYQGIVDDELLNKMYNELSNKLNFRTFDDTLPNDGSVEKVDIESIVREVFKPFNFEGLIAALKKEALTLDGQYIAFQFSDKWGARLFCSAYDRMDETFRFTDWHNF